MERSLFEERKKVVKTAMKEKKETRNLNMKSSDSIERYQRELEAFPVHDDNSQEIGNTFNFDGNIVYQGSPMLELNSFTMAAGINGNI